MFNSLSQLVFVSSPSFRMDGETFFLALVCLSFVWCNAMQSIGQSNFRRSCGEWVDDDEVLSELMRLGTCSRRMHNLKFRYGIFSEDFLAESFRAWNVSFFVARFSPSQKRNMFRECVPTDEKFSAFEWFSPSFAIQPQNSSASTFIVALEPSEPAEGLLSSL